MEAERQQAQQAFAQSEQNIQIGTLDDFPLTLQELKNTTENSSYVVETFNSGLTAIVYHLHLNGKSWTLKLKRPVSLVNNIDGQTSFLNEVQRRRDLTQFKKINPENFKHIVETQFASFRDGIILSPWIVGEPLTRLNRDLFLQIFGTIMNLELNGLFEWDFCPGNILLDSDQQIKLFDFGYMYQFDPQKQFNSNGQNTPLFHGIERFETRFFFDFILKNPLGLSADDLFSLYKIEKQCALQVYQQKLQKLLELGADSAVIAWQEAINQRWQTALLNDSALKELYLLECFRSNLLDLLDDLHGQSCSPYTLQKADLILHLTAQHFDQIAANNGFFFGDELLSKAELMDKYSQFRQDGQRFQLKKNSD